MEANNLQGNGLNRLSDVIDSAMSVPKGLKKEKHLQIRAKYLIDVNEAIPPPQIAYSLANIKKAGLGILGTLGNFSAIIGKPKVKKSFYINIVISAVLSKKMILERIKGALPPDQNEVLYFDTEQGKYHVQKAVQRICAQIDQPIPLNLNTFHLRSLTPQKRLQFIEKEIYSNNKIGFVVIDGIKDLVTSINDEEQATKIVSKLLKWTEERNIHIVTVLHQNKSDNNARGHLGTELINKAETVLEVAKSEADSSISIVTPQQCRNIEPEVFAFEVNKFGIPVIAENFEMKTETSKNKFDVTDMEDFKKYQLLREAFNKGKSFIYSELVIQLKLAFKNLNQKVIGDNKVKQLISDCKNKGWLLQEKNKAPYTLGEFENEKYTPQSV